MRIYCTFWGILRSTILLAFPGTIWLPLLLVIRFIVGNFLWPVCLFSPRYFWYVSAKEWATHSHSVKAESYFSKSYANTFNLFTEQTYIHKALSYTVDFYYSVKWKWTQGWKWKSKRNKRGMIKVPFFSLKNKAVLHTATKPFFLGNIYLEWFKNTLAF